MSIKWSFLIAAGTTAAAVAAAQSVSSAGARGSSAVTAFVNVSVLPMDREQVLDRHTVLVRDDRIAEVGPAAQVKTPAGATRIDGTGKFLMPGLGDMHVHFFRPPEYKEIPDWYVGPRLFCYVANGVTRVRIMDPDTMFVEMRKLVAKHDLPSPRLYAVGILGSRRRTETLQQGLAARQAQGYTFVQATDSLAATAAAAKQMGMELAGDIPFKAGLDGALGAPYGSIEQLHGYIDRLFPVKLTGWSASNPPTLALDSMVRALATPPAIDEARIAELVSATKRAGVWNVPVQSEAQRMVELWSGKTAATNSLVLAARRKMVKALRDSGAGLLVGTDAPAWGGDYGAAVHEELEALVAAGLTPYEALEAGTRNIGKFLGDSAGMVAAGQRADLVLLRANPLDSIGHTKQIAGIMANGEWLAKEKLDARLKADECVGR